MEFLRALVELHRSVRKVSRGAIVQGHDVAKTHRNLLRGLVRLPLDPSVALVSRRFLVRFAILLAFAALPIAGGFQVKLRVLTAVNAIMCMVLALILRERPNGASLTHWDEAFVMTAISLAVRLA